MADITTLIDLLTKGGAPQMGQSQMPQLMAGQQPNPLAQLLLMSKIPRGAAINNPQGLNQAVGQQQQEMGLGDVLTALRMSLMSGGGGRGLGQLLGLGGYQPLAQGGMTQQNMPTQAVDRRLVEDYLLREIEGQSPDSTRTMRR